uniref:Thiamin pyrophosphokinase 1-like n=1 Tax=Nicotiana sylvestris TaxID=4096 RepID=A0A1U7VRW1_NICSY|nr:PREDICTED: thiamin pyrophosphokinase 1-like [Nicotiana sylvestris]
MVARVVSLTAPGVSGDPLSPMLFILVMDALSKMMDRAASEGFLRGFSAPIGVPSARRVSHLLFADDTLVFCDPDMDQLTYLKQVLQWFQIVSGLKINLGKCEIFSVGKVANIDALSYVIRCKVGSLPTTYLCLPLGASHKDSTVWNPVIERVEKRLAEKLEWLPRNFLSDAANGTRKYDLVNWQTVTSPKKWGGLGVKDLRLCILATGALGGLFDHEMGNINVICRFSSMPIILLSDDCLIQLLPSTHHHKIHIQSSVEGPHCGLIPIGTAARRTTTTGLKWNLDKTEIRFGGLVSTSNIVKENIVTVQSESDLLWTISIKKE